MAYASIQNLYRAKKILEFKWCYAAEKVEGSSAHVSYKNNQLTFFAGGAKHSSFLELFDAPALAAKFVERGTQDTTLYGEAYGGKLQGMKKSYGDKLQFVVFEVKIGDRWLDVPTAERVALDLGFEFVPYERGPTDMAWLDAQRDADSIIAIRRGMGPGHKREGVVLRPPFEVMLGDERIVAKHKREDFKERQNVPKVGDADVVLEQAEAIAIEWVTAQRLNHVLDKLKVDGEDVGMERIPEVLDAMEADVTREASGEILDTPKARRAIRTLTVSMFKERLKLSLRGD